MKQPWIPRAFAGKVRFFSTNKLHQIACMSTDTDCDESNEISRHVFDSYDVSCDTVVV